ncbi:MAG: polyprenyl synthetase family protein [Desulfobacterales bacterium]|nr:polyprenyl synthetase family protein [Desulfobacterales bacterium]
MKTPELDALKSYLNEKKAAVDKTLMGYFSQAEGPESELITAMKYSLFAGGKRLRPILCIAGAEAVGGTEADVLSVACAIELIHTYSLIHDDLPCMDDDDLRRGKPSNHKVFGEALALLAGDGLLTEAFNIMTTLELAGRVTPLALVKTIGLIAGAAGYSGMIGGQAVDIQSEGKELDFSLVEFIHTHKTGALITASLHTGAILGRGSETQVRAIVSYGQKIGLAFQISDDILDIEGNSKAMGKPAGSDEQRKKITYPAVLGIGRSKEIQAELVKTAIESLRGLDHRADHLRSIATYIIERDK